MRVAAAAIPDHPEPMIFDMMRPPGATKARVEVNAPLRRRRVRPALGVRLVRELWRL